MLFKGKDFNKKKSNLKVYTGIIPKRKITNNPLIKTFNLQAIN